MSADPLLKPGPALLWGIRLTALAASGVASYLLAISLSQKGLPAGCGAGSGCAEVLTSRWASVLSVPVTVPALLTYIAIIVASFRTTSLMEGRRRIAWTVLLTLGCTVLLAALWFLALQVFVLKSVCPWCLAEHALGGMLAVLIGFAVLPGRRVTVLGGVAAAMLAMFGVGLLAAGQVFFEGPPAPLVRLPADRNADTGPGPERRISVLNGSLPLVVPDEPLLGDPDAKHLVVILFDYCCPHCRETHRHLVRGLSKYQGQYAIVLLPMPLDRKCNPHVEETEPRFENACELARLALAVWNADRTKYAAFDAWLFEPEQPRKTAEARARAESLVGAAGLQKALSDTRIDATIARNVAAYDRSTAGRIPVILSPEFAAIVGRPADEKQLFVLLERELNLK